MVFKERSWRLVLVHSKDFYCCCLLQCRHAKAEFVTNLGGKDCDG